MLTDLAAIRPHSAPPILRKERGTSLPMGERGIRITLHSEVKRSSPLQGRSGRVAGGEAARLAAPLMVSEQLLLEIKALLNC